MTTSTKTKDGSVTIGILGLQGDIEENTAATKNAFRELDVIDGKIRLVKYAEDIEKIDALVLPGGESTVQSTLATIQHLVPELKKKIAEGMPVLGTCAGMIMLSKRVYDRVIGETKQKTIGSLDIVIERNAFGRQNDSFEADLKIEMLGDDTFKGVFIRAPAVSEVGKNVEVIARHSGKIVAVKQDNIIGTAFHPELAGDHRIHRQIVRMAQEYHEGNKH